MRRVLRALYSAGQMARLVAVIGMVAGSGAAWGHPGELTRDEIRCDAQGCSLGACVTQRLWANPQTLATTVRIVPQVVDGKPRGFKLFGLRPGSLPVQLGLENGDVLVSINGQELTGPESALAIYAECRRTSLITLALERRQQPLVRSIRQDLRPLADGECPPVTSPAEAPAGSLPQGNTSPEGGHVEPRKEPAAQLRSLARDIRCKGTRCVLKNGVLDRILADSSLIVRSGRVIPVIKNGQAQGLKMMSIAAGSLWALLGLRNGDVVHAINEFDLNSPDKALEAYTRLRTVDELRVRIDRSGAPLLLVYVIQR